MTATACLVFADAVAHIKQWEDLWDVSLTPAMRSIIETIYFVTVFLLRMIAEVTHQPVNEEVSLRGAQIVFSCAVVRWFDSTAVLILSMHFCTYHPDIKLQMALLFGAFKAFVSAPLRCCLDFIDLLL